MSRESAPDSYRDVSQQSVSLSVSLPGKLVYYTIIQDACSISTYQLFNHSTSQLVNLSTTQLLNYSTTQPLNHSTPQPLSIGSKPFPLSLRHADSM